MEQPGRLAGDVGFSYSNSGPLDEVHLAISSVRILEMPLQLTGCEMGE